MADAPQPRQILELIGAGLGALRDREDDINRMNVFPVPDGDTGTNMVLTMQAVHAECSRAQPGDVAAVAKAATDGSLMGARGNSGVILSQIIRGLADVLGPAATHDVPVMAEALARASTVTLQAIRKPVAGTMLTVIQDAAKAARDLARSGVAMDEFLDGVLAAAWASVQRTPELLPVLKEAGVVDAGGFGLAVLGEGIVRAIKGGSVDEHAELSTTPAQLSARTEAEALDYTYCTEFLVKGEPPDAAEARGALDGMGGSLLVVGHTGLLKVHIHTNDPGAVLTYLSPFGTLAEVHINNMEEQTSERRAALDGHGGAADVASAPTRRLGVVAIAAGAGIAEIMRSLGVDGVVPGGQSMNPSTGEIADAARLTGAEVVIVLPNNKNVILAAQQAAAAMDAERACGSWAPRLIVVGTQTIPEGLAALIAYDDAADPDQAAREMEEEMARVVSGAVTVAVRDSSASVGAIKTGDVIGVEGSDIRVVGSSALDVAADLTQLLVAQADGAETVTLLAGEDFADEEAEALADAVKDRLPGMQVEWHRGDQPLYPVLVGVE